MAEANRAGAQRGRRRRERVDNANEGGENDNEDDNDVEAVYRAARGVQLDAADWPQVHHAGVFMARRDARHAHGPQR